VIFAPESVEAIWAGRKTQTRRPCGRHQHSASYSDDDPRAGQISAVHDECAHLEHVCRLKWKVGRTYAVQPGRCKPARARILLKSIRSERIGDITDEDAMAEGVMRTFAPDDPHHRMEALGLGYSIVAMDRVNLAWAIAFKKEIFGGPTPREAFLVGWRALYPKSDLNELVWVLEFEMVKS